MLPDVELAEPVDALVGRLILMHLADSVTVVKELTRCVRPGGLVTFQEINISRARAIPDVPLVTTCREWICAAQREAGSNPDMGEQLAQVLWSAGLARPEVAVAVSTGGADSPAVSLIAETVRSLLPLIERGGAADARTEDIDTLRGRLLARVRAGAGDRLPVGAGRRVGAARVVRGVRRMPSAGPTHRRPEYEAGPAHR
ncbi:hypothetical protein [Streptomyces hokutonensis]|uniref:hypothetical protein n=1 Tax=Streptomyces hokutonensis TaxID=1306990 RepID=UPI003677E2CF